MVKVEESVLIDRPVEVVWRFLEDLSKVPTWDTSISDVRLTSAGPVGVGSTGDFREKTMNTTISMRVTEYEPNRRFSFVHTSGPAKGSILTFSLETVEGKTRLTEVHSLELSGFYKLLRLFINSSRMRRYIAASLGNAKRMLESEAQS
jgi:uncharacterized protein YndB with AHSA1/START domain